jgi:hypothetical protein
MVVDDTDWQDVPTASEVRMVAFGWPNYTTAPHHVHESFKQVK